MPVHEFKVEMTCTGCSGAVEKVVKKLGDKVDDMSIDLEGKTVQITSNLSGEELLEVLKKTGKEATYLEYGTPGPKDIPTTEVLFGGAASCGEVTYPRRVNHAMESMERAPLLAVRIRR